MIEQTENELSLTPGSKTFLNEAAGWTKFLSIVGFVFVGLMVVGALFMGAFISEMMGNRMGGGAFLTVFYILMAVLYFFPIYYLFQFSAKMKAALAQRNSVLLEQAFENLKSHYKFMGILMIVLLGFYAIALVFMGLGAALM